MAGFHDMFEVYESDGAGDGGRVDIWRHDGSWDFPRQSGIRSQIYTDGGIPLQVTMRRDGDRRLCSMPVQTMIVGFVFLRILIRVCRTVYPCLIVFTVFYCLNFSPTISSLTLHSSFALSCPSGKSILGNASTWLLSRNAPDRSALVSSDPLHDSVQVQIKVTFDDRIQQGPENRRASLLQGLWYLLKQQRQIFGG